MNYKIQAVKKLAQRLNLSKGKEQIKRPEKVFREQQKNDNQAKGGNYHEFFRTYHSYCGVGLIVRRGRRLLLYETPVGVVSHIFHFKLAAALYSGTLTVIDVFVTVMWK